MGVLTMVFSLLALAAPEAPVPGLCTAPAAEHVGEPGCYLSAELDLSSTAPVTHWHVFEFATKASAEAAAQAHPDSVVVSAHGRIWLHVFGNAELDVQGAERRARVGPLAVPAGGQVRLLESWFPPGMKTRVHSHPGPEVFYVVDGQQCVETPAGGKLVEAGEHYVLEAGPHLQAAPQGRRSLVLLITGKDVPWMRLETEWQPTGFCDR